LGRRFRITGDVRIDNRDEVIPLLEPETRAALRAAPDAALVLHAWRRWGGRALDRLVGDFALAIWDAGKRRLTCVRDPLGIKPLYYTRDGDRLLFASAIEPILAALDRRPPFNEPLIRDFLCDHHDRWSHETAYRGIFSLPPAHRLDAVDGRVSTSRYFEFAPVCEREGLSDDEWIERFRELFGKVVMSRTRTASPLGLQVSGGVDSSSMASLIHDRCSRSGHNGDRHPILYSYVSKSSRFKDADEREYLEELVHHCSGWETRLLDNDQMWSLQEDARDAGFRPDEPETWLIRRTTVDLYRQAGQDGCRVVLTGLGGDQVLHGDAYANPYRLGRVRLGELGEEWKYFAHRTGSSTPSLLLMGVVLPRLRPFVPEAVLRLRRRLRRRIEGMPDWVVPNGHDSRTAGRVAADGGIPLQNGYWQRGMALVEYTAASHGIELRHPYLDRRLVEFARMLPRRQLYRGGVDKAVLRLGMRGILAEKIRTRTDRGICWEAVHFGWRKERLKIERYLRDSSTCALGWTDPERLKGAWSRFWAGDDSQTWQLSAWLNVELWLERLGRKPAQLGR
ncbi:MAG: asparagine synthase-related protein, partial [Acidobacteriota bacterium]